jgi:hypothetical protein
MTGGSLDGARRALAHDGVTQDGVTRDRLTHVLDPAFGPANDPAVVALREAIALAAPARPAALAHDDLPLDATDAPLRRYLRWQVRDFVAQRAVFLVPLALLGLYVGWELFRMATARGYTPLGGDEVVQRGFTNLAHAATAAFVVLGTAISTFGIVARERERGLQRFLFAKPVGVLPYYLQKLGVAFVGTLAVTALACVLAAIIFPFAVPVASLAMLALSVATMVAGTIFLVSTLVRFDAPLALFLTALNVPLWALSITRPPWWALEVVAQLHWVVPPAHLVGAFLDPGAPLPPAPVAAALMTGYGLVCALAGLLVLRRRSIIV